MATINDASTTLSPASQAGGDVMDESAPPRLDAAVRKRPRVVLVGDSNESAIVDPVKSDGHWCAPIYAPGIEELLRAQIDLLTRINYKLAKIAGVLP